MKYYILPFALFNIILLAYAQDKITCEQQFSLQGTKCTPCQQTLHKYPFVDLNSFINKQPPSDKCLVASIFQYHLTEGNAASTPNDLLDPVNVKNALDKTCADTANNACSEDYVERVYTEIDKTCDAELNKNFNGTPDPIGSTAFATLIIFYASIPTRTYFCTKIDEYCYSKFLKAANTTQTQPQGQSQDLDPFFGVTCDDCSRQARDKFKEFQASHPLNTPNLQKAFANVTKSQDEFDAKCGKSSANSSSKSNGHRIINDFSKCSGILMGLVAFFYMNFL
ncbi:5132_t:CDS:2 [Funneliformis mosseae]|uniref:5132_t:CDS:1 n=1 Tax=Funneliformis mosseae TaxID=27381 RepID=A0A9N9ARL2_FUNMO|nr:5132_t:CDS:2 [Funneliformis mosseae]